MISLSVLALMLLGWVYHLDIRVTRLEQRNRFER